MVKTCGREIFLLSDSREAPAEGGNECQRIGRVEKTATPSLTHTSILALDQSCENSSSLAFAVHQRNQGVRRFLI